MLETKNGFQSMMTCKEAARYVGIELDRFYLLIRGLGGEKIPHYNLVKRKFFKKEDLDNWIEKHKC